MLNTFADLFYRSVLGTHSCHITGYALPAPIVKLASYSKPM
jgi:hypothetical protein